MIGFGMKVQLAVQRTRKAWIGASGGDFDRSGGMVKKPTVETARLLAESTGARRSGQKRWRVGVHAFAMNAAGKRFGRTRPSLRLFFQKSGWAS